MASTKTRGRRGVNGRGPFSYADRQDNHVIWPGRERDLAEFLGQSFKGMNHKRKNAHSSNSEDALTWSCFATLRAVLQNCAVRGEGIERPLGLVLLFNVYTVYQQLPIHRIQSKLSDQVEAF
jgi:hypothetical protein